MTNRNWKKQMFVLSIGGSFRKEKRGLYTFVWFIKKAKDKLGKLGGWFVLSILVIFC